MKLFDKCPVCGGELVEKEVEKVLKGGSNTAIVKVKAEVCLHCGERLYRPETVSRFEEIRKKTGFLNLKKSPSLFTKKGSQEISILNIQHFVL